VTDIGANVGNYTVLAAAIVGARGHVYAFEPAPENAARLRARCTGLTNVSVFEHAVGECGRNVRLYLDAHNDAQHSLGSHNVGTAGGCVKVRQVALDDVEHLGHIDLIKSDAQGAEFRIIEGARRLIERCQPLMILEFWPYGLRRLGAEPESLLEALKRLGYELSRLSKNASVKSEEHIRTFLADTSRWDKIDFVAVPRVGGVRL
jgi:FkbM family methyltransferase